MSDILLRLLDLQELEWGAHNVRFAFERPMPGWLWVGFIAAAVAFASWSYSRLTGAATARAVLALLRAGLLVAILVLLAGPQLVERQEGVEQDWVIALVDRSASMTILDAPADDASQQRVSREAQLESALRASWPMWSRMAEERTVVWLGFDAGAYDLPESRIAQGNSLEEPAGRRTNLGAAMDQALRRAAARPLAGVVIFSDGQSLDTPSRAALRRLQAERVPVHVVPLGSDEPLSDFAIRRVESPRSAFVDDITPVTVGVERLGAGARTGATVRLIDADTGVVLDEQRGEHADLDRGAADVTLTHRAQDPGDTNWRVVLDTDAPDLIPDNNTAELRVELVDRPLRALYIDGYPRWEHRYLKNLLIRERSITSSNLLLAPDRRYLQEGDVQLARLPASPEEWAEYDVIILGDVRADVFSRAQLEDIREHVAARGGGLMWIGGPGATPSTWRATPLADLIPFAMDSAPVTPVAAPILMRPTPAAQRIGALRLSDNLDAPWPDELVDPATGWSALRWAQNIDPRALKPAVTILAEGLFADDPAADPVPLLLSMRYGAGRVLYLATDEIWRWRYGRGEILPERFWLQLIRLLGRESLARSGRAATIAVSPRRAIINQPVRVMVELLDQSLLDARLASIQVRLTRTPQPGEPEELVIPPVDLTLRPEGRAGRTFAATWIPTDAGQWRARTAESILAAMGLEDDALVTYPDDELRRPETDHQLLARFAEQTGGFVLAAEDLVDLPSMIPNRRQRLISERAEPLWDTPLALIVIVSLLTLEWVGRRLIRLV